MSSVTQDEPLTKRSERHPGQVRAEENVRAQVELHRSLAPCYVERYGHDYSRYYQRDWHQAMVGSLPAHAERVIDLCCGSGFLIKDLQGRFAKVYGIDLSLDMLEVARRFVPDARLIAGSAECMPIRPDSFQAATCKGSLHHTRDHLGFLRDCAAILEPGGIFVISEPCNDNRLLHWLRRAMNRKSDHFDTEDEGFRTQQLTSLLEKAGLEVPATQAYGVIGYTLSAFPDLVPSMKYVPGNLLLTKLFVRIDRLICRLPLLRRLAFQVIVVGQKSEHAGSRRER